MKNKLTSIIDAVSLIKDNDIIGIGGNVLHRAPMALVREIVRQKKTSLQVVKTAGAMDVDILCAGQSVASVDAGFIGYESEYGFANFYRKAVQAGTVKSNEHACYTIISALRAAAYGVPFMPVKGLIISDLIEKNSYFQVIQDPFSGENITVVQAIKLDVTIIHVQEADIYGNAIIDGTLYDDYTLVQASDKVIISTEKIVPTETLYNRVDIPHFMVSAVVEIPNGAKPCSCDTKYDIDRAHIQEFKQVATAEDLAKYLNDYKIIDRGEKYANV